MAAYVGAVVLQTSMWVFCCSTVAAVLGTPVHQVPSWQRSLGPHKLAHTSDLSWRTMRACCHAQAVLVHQLSKGSTQTPFRKNKGRVVDAAFHPSKPFFFVASQHQVLHVEV